jgi:hypothetical protein
MQAISPPSRQMSSRFVLNNFTLAIESSPASLSFFHESPSLTQLAHTFGSSLRRHQLEPSKPLFREHFHHQAHYSAIELAPALIDPSNGLLSIRFNNASKPGSGLG